MGSAYKQWPQIIPAILLMWLSFALSLRINGKICQGTCSRNSTQWTIHRGYVKGYSADGKRCCDFPLPFLVRPSAICGDILNLAPNNKVISFVSPNYPATYSGDLTCKFKVRLNSDTTAIRIDFITFEMDEMKYGENSRTCDSDWFLIKGFIGWAPPPLCGNLTGYSTLIEKSDPRVSDMESLTLVAVMSTMEYRWNVKVRLLSSKRTRERIRIQAKLYQNAQSNTGGILNWKDTLTSQVPWYVSLRTKYSVLLQKYGQEVMDEISTEDNCNYSTENWHFCGGSIIHPQYILSSAHCVMASSKVDVAKSLSDFVVVVGATKRCEDDEGSSTYEVEKIIFHFAYDSTSLNDDVVLLKLKEEIRHEKTNAQMINLAKSGASYTGQIAMASGWSPANSTNPNILQANNNFVILDPAICAYHFAKNSFGNTSFEKVKVYRRYSQSVASIICTAGNATKYDVEKDVIDGTEENGSDTKSESTDGDEANLGIAIMGKGDSGGPLVHLGNDGEGSGEPVLIGIVCCGVGRKIGRDDMFEMSYFQSVSFFRSWITTGILSF